MLHITCDLCGKELHTEHTPFVKIKVSMFKDSGELTEDDLEGDHFEATSQIVYEMDDNSEVGEHAERPKLHYDLCLECHQKYVNHPLHNEPTFTIVWDPKVVTPKEYAELVAALGDVARAAGAVGIKR